MTYLHTKGWYRNAAAIALGFVDTREPETLATALVIDIHALLGISALFAMIIQIGSGIRLHRSNFPSEKRQQMIARIHLIGGTAMVVLWTIVTLAGAAFTIVSKRWEEDFENPFSREMTRFGLWSLGVGTLTNMFLGIRAVRNSKDDQQRDEEKSRNLARHKRFYVLLDLLGRRVCL